jgi:hypothetical protein
LFWAFSASYFTSTSRTGSYFSPSILFSETIFFLKSINLVYYLKDTHTKKSLSKREKTERENGVGKIEEERNEAMGREKESQRKIKKMMCT